MKIIGTNEIATLDFAKAEAEVKRLVEEQIAYNSLLDEIGEFSNKWRTEHSSDYEYEREIDRPRWPAGIAQASITPQMRSERDWVDKQNAEASQRNFQKSQALQTALITTLEVKFPGHSDMFGYCEESRASFNIEEVPLI